MRLPWGKIAVAGIAGGFVGNGILGAIFSSPPIHSLLYDPKIQSALFIEITKQRNIPVSVFGLVVLSIIHSWLFVILGPSIPGGTWIKKGVFWGVAIWAMFWVFQEWFIYHTLFGEPIILTLLELTVLLAGSLAEGLVISFILRNVTREGSI